MPKTSSQQIHAILTDPCASYWLKHSLETAIQRDIVDAVNDAAALLSVLTVRHAEATGGSAAEDLEALQGVKQALYRQAEKIGTFGIIATVARELGEHVRSNYGPKYRHTLGEIEIYVDDYGHFMTVKVGGREVCSTHPCTRLFSPGEWLHAITGQYLEAIQKLQGRTLKSRETDVDTLKKELGIEQ